MASKSILKQATGTAKVDKASKDKPSAPEFPIFEDLNQQIEDEVKVRNFSGTLEQAKEELRDAYMNFKDLQQRCIIDMQGKNKFETGVEEKQVFYFKPETFLLDNPETQKKYREVLLKKVGSVPKPEAQTYLGDDLHKAMSQSIADRSTPKLSKKMLQTFFLRRQYQLQHQKYKMLVRWAHHNLTADSMEMISAEATFLYGKLEMNLEQAMARADRLSKEDYFDQATQANRPSTKSKGAAGALYVENSDLPPQSLIREDDVEVFLRASTYRNKINKTVNKLLARSKWIPIRDKYLIFEQAIVKHHQLKLANVAKQTQFRDRLQNGCKAQDAGQVEQIIDNMYCSKYEKLFLTPIDQLKHQWRANHDEVPLLVADNQSLKLKIADLARKLALKGDVEVDHGFSFSYQVSIFFPTYFQRQVIRSQFSVYDAFACEDQNEIVKRNLFSMAYIDQNIFRDVSTNKQAIPTNESLQQDFKNIQDEVKIMRLKSCESWIEYVALKAEEPSWLVKQQAILQGQPIDSLLQSSLNFLDVNDIATINRLNEDNTHLHRQLVAKYHASFKTNPTVKKIIVQTSDGDKPLSVDLMPEKRANNKAANIIDHLLKSVQQSQGSDEYMGDKSGRSQTTAASSQQEGSLFTLPSHLLTTYYVLRHSLSRDAKTKILYALNYFRSIQKRIAIDLREFATRDRIDGQQSNPMTFSKESSQNILHQINAAAKNDKRYEHTESRQAKMLVFDFEQIADLKNMATLRDYKANGLFSNRIFSTCPAYPKFHIAHGEPIVNQSVAEESDLNAQNNSVSQNSVKLIGRIDFIELNEKSQEVYVKDDLGIYVMYDCCLQDMKFLEKELLSLASYFLSSAETLQDPKQRPVPQRDRQELLLDLLTKEAEFQFFKVKLVQAYMECYEHICDPLEQQKLMSILVSLMARRPRIDLQASYFVDSYDAEVECLKKQFDLVTQLTSLQVNLEKTENKRLQDYLQLSFQMANLYSKNKWQYQDATSLLLAIEKKRQQKKEKEMMQMKEKDIQERQKIFQQEQDMADREANMSKQDSVRSKQSKQTQSSKKRYHDSSQRKSSASESGELENVSMNDENDEDYLKQHDDNQFTNLLGLPSISIESLYMQYKENDESVISLMKEHSNFITNYEGYPEFLTLLTHKSIIQKNKIWKAAPWSQDSGALDFYDSMCFINRYHSITQQAHDELYQGLKMWSPNLHTQIDICVAEQQIKELRELILIQEGQSEGEYEGREYVEDESITGCADKCIFYAKELIADLTTKPKHNLDPFIVAKLDVNSMGFFQFPVVKKNRNKYVLQNVGISLHDGLILQQKETLYQIAKHKVEVEEEGKAQAGGLSPGMNYKQLMEQQARRNLAVPTLLQTYTNMMELLRIRQEVIVAATECTILSQTYQRQCEYISEKNSKTLQADGINFTMDDDNFASNTVVNFSEHGSAHQIKIGLAVKEFDPQLLSNFNFRHPDSIRLQILTSGLEEARAILQYQILQKHWLIVVTRLNAQLLDYYLRVDAELNLLSQPGAQDQKIAIPNACLQYTKVMGPGQVLVPTQVITQLKRQNKQMANQACTPSFQNLILKKGGSRSTIAKEFSNYLAVVQKEIPHSTHTQQRVMRSFRVKLLNQLVQKSLTECYLNAQKVQALQSCNKLRQFNRFFQFDPKQIGLLTEACTMFKFETSHLQELCPYNYQAQEEKPKEETKLLGKKHEDTKVINVNAAKIVDYFGVPSSASLIQIDAQPIEDVRVFRDKRRKARLARWPGSEKDSEDLKEQSPLECDPEKHLKRLLPTFTGMSHHEISLMRDEQITEQIGRSAGTLLDYHEALYFGDSHYSQLARYYTSLERILALEWFLIQLQFSPAEVVHFDNAMEAGLTFFNRDEFDARTMEQIQQPELVGGASPLAQTYLIDQAVSIRQKRDIADQIQSFGIQVKNIITQFMKTNSEKRFEYLSKYTDFRYQQIVGSLYKLIQRFYQTKNIKAVKITQDAIGQLTKMNHVQLVNLQPSNYAIRTCTVGHHMQSCETSSLVFGSQSHEDETNFMRCVQPVLNVQSLEPAQITLFQSLYQTDLIREHPSQFAGQLNTAQMPFLSLKTALIGLGAAERQYSKSFIIAAKYQCNDFMETVYNDSQLKGMTNEDVYSIYQLELARKFMNENTTALLLRNALICWFENSQLPDSAEQYERFEANFRQHFFWKQLQQKEFISKKITSIQQYGQIPSQQELDKLKKRIDQLVDDQNIATEGEAKARNEMVAALKAEFAGLQKKVTLDNYYNTKAEISVFSNEIEKLIIEASVKTLDAECAALSKCFLLSVPSVQYHIHPFQQFAATFFDKVDPNTVLDVSNKVNSIQELLTRMRNRSTEVETLTSGPGLVITIKDLSEIMIDFCKSAINEQQKQFKARNEYHMIREGHFNQLVFFKDRKITNLEERITNVTDNLENVINSRLFEKGNQLIYELDCSNRMLQLFKVTYFQLESKLTEKILRDQFSKFKRKNDIVQMKTQKFDDYKQTIMDMIEMDFAEDQERIKAALKDKAEAAKNTDKDSLYRKPLMFQQSAAAGSGGGNGGGKVSKGDKHYPTCSCYEPNPKYPWPTAELHNLDILSEAEARAELAQANILLRKQRLFWKTKEMLTTEKYESRIKDLTQKQNSNAVLWDQLGEAEKRERVVKQELVYTQQSLVDSQKTIENLNLEIKRIDAEKSRLQKYKQSKVETIKELEIIAKKANLFSNIDTDALINSLTTRDRQLAKLQEIVQMTEERSQKAMNLKERQLQDYQHKHQREQAKSGQVIEKMEQLKAELKLMEKNDASVTSIWKKKCLDLFEVCQSLKKENEELRERCTDMIDQAILLSETLGLAQEKIEVQEIKLKQAALQPQKSLSSATLVSAGQGSQVAELGNLGSSAFSNLHNNLRRQTSDLSKYFDQSNLLLKGFTSPQNAQLHLTQKSSPQYSFANKAKPQEASSHNASTAQQPVKNAHQRDIMSEETNILSGAESRGNISNYNQGQQSSSNVLSPLNGDQTPTQVFRSGARGKSVAQLHRSTNAAGQPSQMLALSPQNKQVKNKGIGSNAIRNSHQHYDIRSILNADSRTALAVVHNQQGDGMQNIKQVLQNVNEGKTRAGQRAGTVGSQAAMKRRSIAPGGIIMSQDQQLMVAPTTPQSNMFSGQVNSAQQIDRRTALKMHNGQNTALQKLRSVNRFSQQRVSNLQLDLQGTHLSGSSNSQVKRLSSGTQLNQEQQIYVEESSQIHDQDSVSCNDLTQKHTLRIESAI